jgi:hypothetical protein
MNTWPQGTVERGNIGPAFIRLISLAAMVGSVGCVDVNGGAVELSWSIFTVGGDATTCEVSRIDHVTLVYTNTDADAGGSGQFARSFPCSDGKGATSFTIPRGRYAIEIQPKCADESDADTTVPSPIVRDIVDGEVAQLNALLIVVDDPQGVACPL